MATNMATIAATARRSLLRISLIMAVSFRVPRGLAAEGGLLGWSYPNIG